MIHKYFSFISVFESSLKPSPDAGSALASHVTDGDPHAIYWFPTPNNLASRFVSLSIPKIMSHTKLCNSAGPDKVF